MFYNEKRKQQKRIKCYYLSGTDLFIIDLKPTKKHVLNAILRKTCANF